MDQIYLSMWRCFLCLWFYLDWGSMRIHEENCPLYLKPALSTQKSCTCALSDSTYVCPGMFFDHERLTI